MKKVLYKLYIVAVFPLMLCGGIVLGAILGAAMGVTGSTVPLWNELTGTGNGKY